MKESVEAMKPIAAQALLRFFGELHARQPEARALFPMPRDVASVASHLALINGPLAGLADAEPDAILRKRFGEFQLSRLHCSWIGTALKATLQHYFDDTWTPELESAWDLAIDHATRLLTKETPMRDESEKKPAALAPSDADLKAEIDLALDELIRGAISDAVATQDIRQLAANSARALIQECLTEQLKALRERFQKLKKAA